MGKMSVQDLAAKLVEKNGLSKRDAVVFVNTMFDIVRQALERDKMVKIKGLGTFKIVEVDARESVNVNTGERVLIDGHNKISFTPDPLMKELVNKPFSQFETVVLNDGVDFEEGKEQMMEEALAAQAKAEAALDSSAPADVESDSDSAAIPLVDFGAVNEQSEVEQKTVEQEIPVVENTLDDDESIADEPIENKPIGEENPTIEENSAHEKPVVEENLVPISEVSAIQEEQVAEELASEEELMMEEDLVVEEEPVIEKELADDLETVVEDTSEVENTSVLETLSEVEEKAASEETANDAESDITDHLIHAEESVDQENPDTVDSPVDEEEPVKEDLLNEETVADDETIAADEESDNTDIDIDEDDTETGGYKRWLIPLIVGLLSLAVGYLLGNYFPFKHIIDSLDNQQTPVVVEPVDKKPASKVKEQAPVLNDSTEVKQIPDAEAGVDGEQKNDKNPEKETANEPVKETTTEAPAKTQDQYEAMDVRVRLGAYSIVGTDFIEKAREGDNLPRIARRTLGPDMECYIEVYNNMTSSSVLKKGQEIKIPKLQLKKKKKLQK